MCLEEILPRVATEEHTENYLNIIVKKFGEIKSFENIVRKLIDEKKPNVTVTGLAGSSAAIMLANLAEMIDRPIVAVITTPEEAGDFYDDVAYVLGDEKVAFFPSLMTPPYEFRSPSGEIVGQRLSTLARIRNNQTKIIVTPVAALIEPTIAFSDFEKSHLQLSVGDEMEIGHLAQRMVRMGFNRVPLVEEVGDFALRGGLVDFFSPGFEAPIRIEFFGDEIDTIRQFEVSSQRTTERLERISLLPRREISITQETVEQYIEKMPEDDADLIRARYLNDPDLPGLEWLATAFNLESGCLFDFISTKSLLFLEGIGNLKAEIDEILKDSQKRFDRVKDRMESPPPVEEYFKNKIKIEKRFEDCQRIDHVPFKGGRGDILDFECRAHPSFNARLDLLSTAIDSYYKDGINFFIAADNPGQAARLNELMSERIESSLVLPIGVARLKGGFVSRENKFAILTDHQIFGRHFRRIRRKKFKEGVAIQSYSSLTPGDFVVHTDFGIAKYMGLKTIKVSGRMRDCLHLNYANKDKLYVPIEEFNRVSKYSGKDSVPRLSALGGSGWEKVKARTKKAIEDMAADLIEIYAVRKTRPGFAFGPDTTWMKQLEASFPYDETVDQQKAIRDIKVDMERAVPMDRLVCGDVGYGKTEVAIRAAFKAVESGKQVAVLVPTTILAQQHLTTFKERLSDFPLKIDMLSRFKTRKEQKAIVEELSDGKVDIVIGTHRLLSEDVRFSDLGLLIVDEEHRFGVKHKETLRKLKTTVDTIALTATPIPRTLQMSMMGIRDMSLINTSPKDRLPVLTYISEFDPGIIAEAILREVDRGGQVFFVHNRVQSIEAIYRYLKKLLPQVEIAIAHGQMHERSLEGIMLAFLSGTFQVLLSTSIIESGLDIPSVNTIVVNRADRFGLAQLYQLRGRVGRSTIHARAYLLTPPYRLLSEDARKRLRAIEAHADLGSGFALAMKDLEIRGAGNILGAQQSGFIEEVGFDLYTKLLEEAVAKIKGEEVLGAPDSKIETDIVLMIPDNYINIMQQKVEIYQRVAGARTLDELEHIRDDVIDRFGKAPQPVDNLFDAAAVKISAWVNGVSKVKMRSGRVELFFEEDKKFSRKEIENWRREIDYPMEFSLTGKTSIKIDLSQLGQNSRFQYLRAILNRI